MSIDDDNTARINGDDDIESFTTKNRLRSLFEARDDAATAIREASMKELQLQERGVTPENATRIVDKHVRESTRAYVYECEPLLRNTNIGLNLYQNQPLDTIPLPQSDGATTVQIDGETIEDGVYSIHGIQDYIKFTGATVTKQKTQMTDKGITSQSSEYTITPPRELSESVFRSLNTLLADLGIGLEAEVDGDDDEWNI